MRFFLNLRTSELQSREKEIESKNERLSKKKRNIQKLLICILMDRAAEDHMNEMNGGISSLLCGAC